MSSLYYLSGCELCGGAECVRHPQIGARVPPTVDELDGELRAYHSFNDSLPFERGLITFINSPDASNPSD